MTKFQSRQGDIFFESVSQLPSNVKPHNSRILAYGEVTGHAHALVEDTPFTSLVDEQGNIYLRSEQKMEVEHDEHDTVELPSDEWIMVSRQREYDPLAIERERLVAD